MTHTKQTTKDLLRKLEGIAAWFDEQEEVDVETGLEKVKEGAKLIKELKISLKAAENEFEEIKKDLNADEK